MSYLLFVDESGTGKESPYEVLAGVCISDQILWDFVREVQEMERSFFGERYSPGLLELKGMKLLKRKIFRLASQLPPFNESRRRDLAHRCLEKGKTKETSTREELTALAQAKIAFVTSLLDLCAQHEFRAFANIVDKDAPRPSGDYLRKDYAYLFERFFYFLEDRGRTRTRPRGV